MIRDRRFISSVFTSVSGHYNLMNDLMSLGLHRQWKNLVNREIPAPKFSQDRENQKFRLIDVAGGTADIAKRAISRYNIDATVCDINCSMLEEGRDIAINQNITNLKFICGDAENLPFLSNFFDCYTIAFGIRNVVNRESALREAFRVLKVGGKFICLEFSPLSDSNHLKKIYDFYSFKIIPKMGKVIANNEEAYQYLVDSIRAFPSPGEFNAEISSVGFKKNLFRQMSLGVVSIHTAWKI